MEKYQIVILVLSIVVYFASGLILGFLADAIAKEKGYTGRQFLVIPIFFNVFGYIAACSLPDKKADKAILKELDETRKILASVMDESEETEARPAQPQPAPRTVQPTPMPRPVQPTPSPRPQPVRPQPVPQQNPVPQQTRIPQNYQVQNEQPQVASNYFTQNAQPQNAAPTRTPYRTPETLEGFNPYAQAAAAQPQNGEVQPDPSATAQVHYADGKVLCSRCKKPITLMTTTCPHCKAKIVASPNTTGLGYIKPID